MPKTLSEVQVWLNTIVPLLRSHYNIELEEVDHLHGFPTMYLIIFHAVIKKKYYSNEVVISCSGIWKGDVMKSTAEDVRELLVPEVDVRVNFLREALISVDEEPIIVADTLNGIISRIIFAHTIKWDLDIQQVFNLIQAENVKKYSGELVDITYVDPEVKIIYTPWGEIETKVFYMTYTYVAQRDGDVVYYDVVQSLNMPRVIKKFRLYSVPSMNGFLHCDNELTGEQTNATYNSTFYEDREALCKQVVHDIWRQHLLPDLFSIKWDMLFHQQDIQANGPNKRARAS